MENYLINGSTLAATADKIREILNQSKLMFDPGIVNNDGTIDPYTISVGYQEWVDNEQGYDGLEEGQMGSDEFIAYDYLEDNNGVLTPVMYKTDIYGDEPDSPDYNDTFFYQGKAEIEGTTYDKWRKIEIDQGLGWDSVAKKYVYTDQVIISNEIYPIEFPNKIQEVFIAGGASGGETSNVEQATPTITVSETGLITATSVQLPGYVAGGTKGSTKQLSTKAGTTYTPGTSTQTVVTKGTYTTGDIKIGGTPSLKSENIKSGANIFGVQGSSTVVDTKDATATAKDIPVGKTAYVNGQLINGARRPIEISDLTGTTWKLNFNTYPTTGIIYSIDFISNNTIYNSFVYDIMISGRLMYGSGSDLITMGTANSTGFVWANYPAQYVTFTGGTAVTNADFIEWLYTYGEPISATGYYEQSLLSSLGTYHFRGCDLLVAANLKNLITIGTGSFTDCKSLVNIIINNANSLKTIETSAFSNCTSLAAIAIPDKVTTLGTGVFNGCTGLLTAKLGTGITSIPQNTFYNCKSLKKVDLGNNNSITSIGDYAFRGCESLTTFTIPGSVTTIGAYAFQNCTGLTSLYFGGTKAKWQSITKGTYWNLSLGATSVICTDGGVAL